MSRLLTNSEQTREFLESRNLYNPDNPYDANASNTVETINSIVNIVSPFTSFDLTNTVVGRLVGNNTPLAQIGLQMLATQFGYTAASNAAADYLPAIKFSNLFDGDPDSKFLAVKRDFQITRRETQSNIGKILEEISGRYPKTGNPFTNSTTNVDYIINSGKGQLQLLVQGLNANKYKPSSEAFFNAIREEGFNYGDMPSVSFRNVFPSNDNVFYPYRQYKISKGIDINSINDTFNFEQQTYRKLTEDSSNYLEYGGNQEFLDALGKAFVVDSEDKYGEVGGVADVGNYGLNDNIDDQLIWGRDGINTNYQNEVGGFDNQDNGVQPNESGELSNKTNPRFTSGNNIDAFDMEAGGLLSYTRELLNTKGKYSMFDMTKKKFVDTDENLHFNGSPISRRITGEKDQNRQHSTLDPYNNFVKAIRFNGNKIYNGNSNSVIYNSVMPQVAPIVGAVNKNLMFSIENLAVRVNEDEDNNIGIVEDAFGTELPLCEVGPRKGRLMWFPPYDIQLNENVVVHRETTNFIGRGEPIYTYSNTERMANLSFKLIIDYPPNVKGMDHTTASKFFAFGGEAPVATSNLGDKIKKRNDLIKSREEIQPTKKLADPQTPSQTVNFHFANDLPTPGSEQDTVLYHLDILEYEISTTSESVDGTNFTLNDQFKNNIENYIIDYLGTEEKRKFTQIRLVGSASDLFIGTTAEGAEYNQLLSERRVSGIRSYIEQIYKNVTGRNLVQDGIKIITDAVGGTGGTSTDDAVEIPTLPAKEARRVSIFFEHNGVQDTVDVPLTEKEIEDKAKLDADIQSLDTQISQQRRGTNLTGCDFNPYVIQDGVVMGFEAMQKNKYKPAFHSQTPEDFHRRLTFLHQCTRQGESVRKLRGDGTNTFTANNAVFGRQPVQILRIGDMFNTKIIIDNMQIDYSESPWDMNPEGMGMQFMIADVKLQIKLVGGQSLKGPIDALQNAVSYNYYANSTFYNDGVYANATDMETRQYPPNEENSVQVQKVTTTENDASNEFQPSRENNIPNN